MPLFFLSLEPGSDTNLYQETLYRSESCRRRLRKTAHCCLQGWPLKFVKHIANANGAPPTPAGAPGSCPLHLLYLSNLSFMIGIPNRCCILKLSVNQCFVCNFLSVPRCKGKIALKKTQCLSCLS